MCKGLTVLKQLGSAD